MVENGRGQRRFMNHKELIQKLGFPPMRLEYRGLLNAIPKRWKAQILKDAEHNIDEEDGDIGDNTDQMLDREAPAKLIFSKLVKQKTNAPCRVLDK